jgi:Zn-dependent M28 family amino/carboxypeptidase
MKGRLPGTQGEMKSADYIAEELKRIGCKPLKRKRFVHPFDYTADATLIHSYGNVVGRINTRSDQCVIITAHYDHIGNGYHHSKDPFNHSIYNGADDNASGVAMLLAMAEWCFTHRKELKYDVIFAAVSGEEDGLFGSAELLRCKYIDTSSIVCNINFDMVGHLDLLRPLLIAEGVAIYPIWNNVLPRDTTTDFTVVRRAVQYKDGSDHCTFINAKIPAILLTTGTTQFYHRPSDDANTINYKGMVSIGWYVKELLLNLNKYVQEK